MLINFLPTSLFPATTRPLDAKRAQKALKNNNVIVVAGFQGINEQGDVTTLGRGGSDTSAVALAVALGASQCEIYTDVDGVYTADPRMVHIIDTFFIQPVHPSRLVDKASLTCRSHVLPKIVITSVSVFIKA